MSRAFFLDLARRGLAMPLAVDLLLHEISSPEKVDTDPAEMARVMIEAARRFRTPLAVAPMDLRVEKAALGQWLAIPPEQWEEFHFSAPLSGPQMAAVRKGIADGLTPRMNVLCEAFQIVAREAPDLYPTGMVIGPFSLFTKIAADPITAVFMLGQGFDADDEPSVGLAQQLLELNTEVIAAYCAAQGKAGAKAIIMCEPAANTVYLSPNSLEENPDLLEEVVLEPIRKIKKAMNDKGAEFILHDCGELTVQMVKAFGELEPVLLSFGSPTDIPAVAHLVPDNVVLFGNVPSKHFPSDDDMPKEKVKALCDELREKMAATGKPFILGSECDVLSVKGREDRIREKAEIIASCSEWTG